MARTIDSKTMMLYKAVYSLIEKNMSKCKIVEKVGNVSFLKYVQKWEKSYRDGGNSLVTDMCIVLDFTAFEALGLVFEVGHWELDDKNISFSLEGFTEEEAECIEGKETRALSWIHNMKADELICHIMALAGYKKAC